jgi:hypothetical protein
VSATYRIDREARDLADRRPGAHAPAVEGAQPHDELGQLERLREVVVRAELEARRLVAQPVRRRQHEDRGA